MTTDELLNIPYEIQCFIARNKKENREYEFYDYWRTKMFCDFYGEEENGYPWEIYAKIKNTPTTLPRKP